MENGVYVYLNQKLQWCLCQKYGRFKLKELMQFNPKYAGRWEVTPTNRQLYIGDTTHQDKTIKFDSFIIMIISK